MNDALGGDDPYLVDKVFILIRGEMNNRCAQLQPVGGKIDLDLSQARGVELPGRGMG